MYLFRSLNNIMKSQVWILVISITEMKKLQNWMMSWESHFGKKDKFYLSWKNCFVSRFHHYLKLRLSKLLNTHIPHLEINNNTTSQDQVAQWLSAYQSKDSGLILGLERSPGGGNGNPLQYSCLENPKDRGALRVTIHGVTKIGHDWVTEHIAYTQDYKCNNRSKNKCEGSTC